MTTIKFQNHIKRVPVSLKPYEGVGELQEAKQMLELPLKFPDWDVARNGPMSNALATRRQLQEVKNRLRILRRKAKTEKVDLDEDLNQLEEEHKHLRSKFIKFNKFTVENTEKHERADMKKAIELKAQLLLNEDIDDIKNTLAHFQHLRELLKENLEKYSIYTDFLERIVEETQTFTSVADVLARYTCLTLAKSQISIKENETTMLAEKIKNDLKQLGTNKNDSMCCLMSEVIDIAKYHDKLAQDITKWISTMAATKEFVIQRNGELDSIRFCSWNMYQQLSNKFETPVTLTPEDVGNQMIYIKQGINTLKRIQLKTIEDLISNEVQQDTEQILQKVKDTASEPSLKLSRKSIFSQSKLPPDAVKTPKKP